MRRVRSKSSLRGEAKVPPKSQSPICVYVDDDASVHLHIGKGKEASAHAVDELVSKRKAPAKSKNSAETKSKSNLSIKETEDFVDASSRDDLEEDIREPDDIRSETASKAASKRNNKNASVKEKDVDDYLSHQNNNTASRRSLLSEERRRQHSLSEHIYADPAQRLEIETGDPMRRLGRILLEAEVVSETTQQEIHKLFILLPDLIREGHFVSAKDVHILHTLQDSCLNRLSEFQLISTDLRSVLRNTQDMLNSMNRLQFASHDLSDRVAEYEAVNRRLQATLLEREDELEELRRNFSHLKEESLSSSTMQDSLQNTKAHLQKQLRQKEADCNRMAVQIRTLESQLARNKLDCEYMASLLKEGRTRIDDDREELKKAAKVLKQRLHKTEATLAEVQTELAQKKEELKTAKSDTQAEISRNQELMKERANLLIEKQELNSRLVTTEERMNLQRERNALHMSQMSLHEAEKDDEIEILREENKRLHKAMNKTEERLNQAELEMEGMREGLMHYESLTHELAAQNESKHCANVTDLAGRLQETQKELSKVLSRLQESERRLRSMEEVKNELTDKSNKREDQVRSLQRSLDEKSRENSALMQQLEAALVDARRQNENGREKQIIRERQLHSRIHELEAELVRVRGESTRLRHERDDVERRTQSQLQDIRTQLERSDVSNRSMQNYIQFLKKSYANSFDNYSL